MIIRENKTKSIDTAKSIFADNSVVILLNYKGLNAKGIYGLRKGLKAKQANVKILKNTLVKKALAENTATKDLLPEFKDQIAVAYANDPVALSNTVVNFAKNNELVQIKIGFMDGKLLVLDTIKELSSLGSIDDVRAKFIGLLKAPGSKLARTLVAKETKMKEE